MERLVSVIIPTINRPQFLKLAVESALKQDYPAIEILISDNGSTDETPVVVSTFVKRDPRVRTRKNETTVDIITHVNQCFSEARGEYVVLLSDDDMVNETFVSGLVKAFESAPNVTVAFPHCISINKEGAQQNDFGVPSWKVKRGPQYLNDWLWNKEQSFTGTFFTLFARRDMVLQFGGQPNFEKGLHSDNSLLMNLCMAGSVGFAPEAIFYYRVYQQSTGLSQPYAQLAKASKQFLDYTFHHPISLSLLLNLTFEEVNQIQRGAARMSAQTYLWRLRDLYKLQGNELGQALQAYEPDIEFLKCLREFDFSPR